jgi:hydrogenase maturation protease
LSAGSTGKERIPLLIAGLGNSLLMDDGVGVHAVRELKHDPPYGATVVEVGTAVLDALHLLERADRVIALDAVQAGQPAGTIVEVRPSTSRDPGPGQSLHELDLRDALLLLPGDRRPEMIILGVEPERIDYGLELSPAVGGAFPEFVDTVRRTAAAFLG